MASVKKKLQRNGVVKVSPQRTSGGDEQLPSWRMVRWAMSSRGQNGPWTMEHRTRSCHRLKSASVCSKPRRGRPRGSPTVYVEVARNRRCTDCLPRFGAMNDLSSDRHLSAYGPAAPLRSNLSVAGHTFRWTWIGSTEISETAGQDVSLLARSFPSPRDSVRRSVRARFDRLTTTPEVGASC